MFRSSLNFFSGSWDTSFARQFLRIPKDQLDMINSIPEWSTQEISNKSADDSKSTFEETDNQSIVKTAQLKNCCPNSISAKNIDILKQQGDNSLPKFKAVATSVEKETILRNLSSSAKKKKSTFGVLKRSQSLTDIYQAPESIKIFSHRKSADFKRYLAMSTGESFSCPLEYSDLSSKKRNLEKLDESILNHRYLKGIKSTSAVKSLKKFENCWQRSVQSEIKQDTAFGKRLMLLEKRIRSPSKEFDSLIKNSESSNSIKSLQTTTAPADEILATKIHTHVDENPLIAKIAMASKTPAIEWHKNPQSLPEKQVSEPVKDLIANPTIRKTNFDYEESFLSPPVPCGQVPAKEIHSSSQKHDKKTSPNKLQNKEHYNENMIPEKSSATFSVFSANCNEKALILKSVPEKEQRVKRKHRSRSEKSGKSNAKKQKMIDIQFSTDQIKNMLDIMKVFHSSI